MKRPFGLIIVLIVVLAIPATSFAFYQLGEINEYVSYDRFHVTAQYYDKNLTSHFHPMLQGRLINETNEKVYVIVHLYFCDIFNKRYNSVTLSKSLYPDEKYEFNKGLDGYEYETTRNAHHIEFQVETLIVGGKNMLR
jgi:hypothetical protein